jgi:ferric-dicitrate binding protein FerR (iron transport regulator)
MIARPYFDAGKKAQTAWYEIEAPLGAKSQVSLIDGTKVWLNAGSKLQYSTGYGQENREVRLTGEGYFEVAKNKALPFEVKTSGITVRALGTAFNVKAYPNDATIETILVEGEVEITQVGKTEGIDKNEHVLLKPKQRFTLKKNTNEMLVETTIREKEQTAELSVKQQQKPLTSTVKAVETTLDLMSHTSWKDKRWRIESEALGGFATKLERRYNVKIVFQDKDLPKYRFNGTFEDEPIEEVLRALALAAPVNFTLKGNQVVLSRNNKFKEAFQSLYELNSEN